MYRLSLAFSEIALPFEGYPRSVKTCVIENILKSFTDGEDYNTAQVSHYLGSLVISFAGIELFLLSFDLQTYSLTSVPLCLLMSKHFERFMYIEEPRERAYMGDYFPCIPNSLSSKRGESFQSVLCIVRKCVNWGTFHLEIKYPEISIW